MLGLGYRTYLIISEYKLDKSFSYVWGMKHSGQYLRKKVKKTRLIYIEDGFIHSFGDKKNMIPLSICLDKNGIYYDSNCKSDLIKYIKHDLSNKDIERSKKIIKLWKEYSISKYNFTNIIQPPKDKYILLIDQTFGDLSIFYGEAKKYSFSEMFDFATKNWPEYKILIKVHPDVINKEKLGCLDKSFYERSNVIVNSELGQINKLIEFSSAVCTVTSQVGFEALIYEKEVHVFGKPFYSGLGLTNDHQDHKNLIKNLSIEQLVFALLVRYQIYLDPRTKQKCEVEDIMQYIKNKREVSKFFPKDIQGINLTPWKARQINRFVYDATGKRIEFFGRFKSKAKNIIVWGKNSKSDSYITKVNNFITAEDGFIRSVGLGGDLYPPLSLLFDKKGIHYDGSKVSDLENLLQKSNVNQNEILRAKKIKDLIIELKISKYNLRLSKKILHFDNIKNREVIGVLGQVETDNSIIYGVPDNTIKKTNFALVEQVRKDYPHAFIIYKPHPDIESGLRANGAKDYAISEYADLIAYETSLEDLFNKVDRIAVFTSLGGFEALIRGISVSTYGFPFYAGWGLTDDKLDEHIWAQRRTRKLTIEELTYIALIKYPFYSSVKFDCLTEIEHIIDEITSLNMKKNLEQIIFKYWGALKDRFLTFTK